MANRTQYGPKTKRGRSLKTLQAVRRLAADTVRDVERATPEEIPPVDRARLLLYGAQILQKLIVESDLEVRVNRLERPSDGPAATH